MDNINAHTTATPIRSNTTPTSSFPVILVAGPPHAGKSVLTYNLTRELRDLEIPHFVFRASPDFEGDWLFDGDFDTVQEIRDAAGKMQEWPDAFRALICKSITYRQFPLIVDIGGRPHEADAPILKLCTHSILLLKEDDSETSSDWQRFIERHNLTLLAELYSRQHGRSNLVAQEPVVKGTITHLERNDSTRHVNVLNGDYVFNAVIDAINRVFSPFPWEVVENTHFAGAPKVHIFHAERELASKFNASSWKPNYLEDLQDLTPANTEIAVYGRAPNWVYGALAMRAYPQPIHQFDACIGWVKPQVILVGDPTQNQGARTFITLKVREGGNSVDVSDAYVVLVTLNDYYIDYADASQLVFPALPTPRGVIISGKLPFWLFNSLARFYADQGALWIAMNYARDSKPVVVYAHEDPDFIGQQLPILRDILAQDVLIKYIL